MDAVYFRVSSDRQTMENQYEDVLRVAQQDGSGRNWNHIRELLNRCIYECEERQGRSRSFLIYKVRPDIGEELADYCVYLEQRSAKIPNQRPIFQRLKHDAALHKFDRVLVWKVTRLGRNMREILQTVYELADMDVTIVPVKSQTGPIHSSLGRLLWAIQAWYAEFENEERSQTIKAGMERARANGSPIGRPRVNVTASQIASLRAQGLSWRAIARELGISGTSARRYLQNRAKTIVEK